ncbi:MAG: hypothetical protein WAS05_07440 [Candidatus Nanopelagicales bacterium]
MSTSLINNIADSGRYTKWRPFAVATALATAAAVSIFEPSAQRGQAQAAPVKICSQSANGLYEFEGNPTQSVAQNCTTTRAGVVRIVARGAGGGSASNNVPGGAGAVVTTHQFLPKGTVLTVRVGHTSYHPSGGGGGYGGGAGGANFGGNSSGGGAGGSHASTTRAAYGFSTTFRPGGTNQTPQNGSMQNGSVSISFVQDKEKPRPQVPVGSCAAKIPTKKVKLRGKTVVLPANCKTNANRKMTVSAKWFLSKKNVTKNKKQKWLKRKTFKNGKVQLVANNVPKKTKVTLVYSAPRTSSHSAYKVTKTIRLRK